MLPTSTLKAPKPPGGNLLLSTTLYLMRRMFSVSNLVLDGINLLWLSNVPGCWVWKEIRWTDNRSMVLSPFAILLPSFVCSVLLLAFVCVYLSKARQQHSNSFRMIIRTSQIMDNTRGRHARTHSNECQILFPSRILFLCCDLRLESTIATPT